MNWDDSPEKVLDCIEQINKTDHINTAALTTQKEKDMSTITQSGNLAGVPELKTSAKGNTWCAARVIHNERKLNQGTGEWEDVSQTGFTVRVYGRDAAALVAAAEANGNIRVHFGGRFTIVDFQRKDGSHGRAYEVDADFVAVGLGQDVALTKGAGRDASESWGSGYGEEPAGWADQH